MGGPLSIFQENASTDAVYCRQQQDVVRYFVPLLFMDSRVQQRTLRAIASA